MAKIHHAKILAVLHYKERLIPFSGLYSETTGWSTKILLLIGT